MALWAKGVEMLGNIRYEEVGEQGLRISEGDERANARWLEVDHIVLCAGQISLTDLVEPLKAAGKPVHVIGGAFEAGELDAKRAIDMGTRLGARL